SPAGAAGVDWYSFTLAQPASVTLNAVPATAATAPVLSLYNSDQFDWADPFDPLGDRLVAQTQAPDGVSAGGTSGDGTATLTRPLAAGTYYVAVSGAGNDRFNPFIAGSGYAGSTGPYLLQLSAADLNLDPAGGPIVLTSEPAANQSVDHSPLVIRL